MTRESAATDAGLSEHQRKTALRVANVPREEFEAAIEGDRPATVTWLADRGKQARVDHLKGRTPEDFRQATLLLGLLHHVCRNWREIDHKAAIRGLLASDRDDALKSVEDVGLWWAYAKSVFEA